MTQSSIVEVEVGQGADRGDDRQAVDGDAAGQRRRRGRRSTGGPMLLAPSPETSMIRRAPSTAVVLDQHGGEVERARDRGAAAAQDRHRRDLVGERGGGLGARR